MNMSYNVRKKCTRFPKKQKMHYWPMTEAAFKQATNNEYRTKLNKIYNVRWYLLIYQCNIHHIMIALLNLNNKPDVDKTD